MPSFRSWRSRAIISDEKNPRRIVDPSPTTSSVQHERSCQIVKSLRSRCVRFDRSDCASMQSRQKMMQQGNSNLAEVVCERVGEPAMPHSAYPSRPSPCLLLSPQTGIVVWYDMTAKQPNPLHVLYITVTLLAESLRRAQVAIFHIQAHYQHRRPFKPLVASIHANQPRSCFRLPTSATCSILSTRRFSIERHCHIKSVTCRTHSRNCTQLSMCLTVISFLRAYTTVVWG